MNSLLLQQSALVPPALSEKHLPFNQSLIQFTQKDYIELKCQAVYWKTQHERVVGREEILKEQLKQKDARIQQFPLKMMKYH